MAAIENVLSKPLWPSIDSRTQEVVLNHLSPLCVRGGDDTFKVGFNDTMRSIEKKLAKAIFVARSDLNPAECMPLALASAAYRIPLVTLPKGSKQKLGTGVTALCSDQSPLFRVVQEIGSAKLDWVYQGATLIQKKKNSLGKVKKEQKNPKSRRKRS